MIVVIIPVVSGKSLTVLLLEGVIVQVYFNTMACKKSFIFNYSEAITCFTVFCCCKIKSNWYCNREINLEYWITLNRVFSIHVNCSCGQCKSHIELLVWHIQDATLILIVFIIPVVPDKRLTVLMEAVTVMVCFDTSICKKEIWLGYILK